MAWHRIRGIIRQDLYILRHEGDMWADMFFFSIINVLVFGLIAKHFAGSDPTAAIFVVSGMLMWEVVRLCQYTVTIVSLMNVWSKNLSNMFIAPISLVEYVCGNAASAIAKTVLVLVPLSVATWLIFDFNILNAGIGVLLFAFVDLVIFAVCLGLILLGFVFRFGVRVQALAWSAVYLFQPLIGVYFPLDVLPGPVQAVAQLIPATHAFEGVRNSLLGTGPVLAPLALSAAMGIALLVGTYFVFRFMHARSMVIGQFARNDS